MGLTTYLERKKTGLCVRCGMPSYEKRNGEPGVLCATHARMQEEYSRVHRSKLPPLDPYALTDAAPDPDRERWAPKTDKLPALPKVCPRCASMLMPAVIEVFLEYTEGVRCPCCGYITDRQMLQNKLDAENGAFDEPELGRGCGHNNG